MNTSQKRIDAMIEVLKGSVADKEFLSEYNIDCVVNAARPTLMGSPSSGCVDYDIHNTINRLFREEYEEERLQGGLEPGDEIRVFEKEICKELGTSEDRNLIRCRRGEAVLTHGYGLCKYIIHVVGSEYDGVCKNNRIEKECTSSCLALLKKCYENIVEEIKKQPDIKRIAIPIISAGSYGFPYELAVKVALAGTYNALVRWRKSDSEMFHAYSGIEKIYFVVMEDEGKAICDHVLQSYMDCFRKNKLVVFQSAKEATKRYLREIQLYDKNRGYFSVARTIRSGLLTARKYIDVSSWIKDCFGGVDWEKRRLIVEGYAVFKVLIPIILYLLYEATGDMFPGAYYHKNMILASVTVFSIVDTLSYLLLLIVVADIQSPSANVIRSMIMLFVNYVEVALDFSVIYYWIYEKNNVTLLDSLQFGLFGEQMPQIESWVDLLLSGSRMAFGFFFSTLVIGYFMGHLHQRQFRS